MSTSSKKEKGTYFIEANIVFVDGVSLGNPGPAGYAATFVTPSGGYHTVHGSAVSATGNAMKLKATVAAVKRLKGPAAVLINSRYVVDGLNRWRHKWKNNGWRTSDRRPIQNRKVWQQLHKLMESKRGVVISELPTECDEVGVRIARKRAIRRARQSEVDQALPDELEIFDSNIVQDYFDI